MKKISIILLVLFLFLLASKKFDMFSNIDHKFENSIFLIHSQNIDFSWKEPYKNKDSYESLGTGFLIDKSGLILTCSHVIDKSIRVYVSLPIIGKKTFETEVINFCPSVDIALLRIKNMKEFKDNLKNELQPLELGDSDKIKPGEKSLALGYPLGEDKLKRTSGIISGIQDGSIQTDTPINPGNSGGPLINKENKVIGINFSINIRGINIGYAVPINRYYLIKKMLLTSVKKIGIIQKPVLGIQLNNTNKHMINFLSKGKIKNNNGYLISKVLKDCSFYNSGIRTGDILLSFDGNVLDNFGESKVSWSFEKVNLFEIALRFKHNDKIKVTYYSSRDDIIKDTQVVLKDNTFYNIREFYPPFEKIDYIVFSGLVMMNLAKNHFNIFDSLNNYKSFEKRVNKYLIITKILPGSYIKRNKIFSEGNIIAKINNIPVNNVTSAKEAIRRPIILKGKKFIKFENINNKIFILDLDKVKKEEIFLSRNFYYKSINL